METDREPFGEKALEIATLLVVGIEPVEVVVDGSMNPMIVGSTEHLERYKSVPIANKTDVDCSLLVGRR